jgi:apolipoprotein N-acyltransferase
MTVRQDVHGIPWNSMDSPWNSFQFHGTSWLHVKVFHGLPWNSIHFPLIPVKTMKYHGQTVEI